MSKLPSGLPGGASGLAPKLSVSAPDLDAGVRGVTAGPARHLRGAWASWVVRWRGLTDRQLAWLLGSVLLVVTGYPLALTEVPPFQDLPNHLAAIAVIERPELYPEFVFNGFFKTNTALFLWLLAVGKVTGTLAAARLFALLVVATNAFVIPRFVLAMTGSRGRMVAATALAWPMVHNWFVSMGMLDFALGVPLSLAILALLHGQLAEPSARRVVGIVLLGAVTWCAHVFALHVVFLLTTLHVMTRPTWEERLGGAKRAAAALFPVVLLAGVSTLLHMRDEVGPMSGFVNIRRLLPPWELAYNLFAEWMWGFTKLSLGALVPAVLIGWFAWHRRAERPMFFEPTAMLVLGALFVFSPYVATNWFHVNSRFIPYLWFGMLLRTPPRLPRAALAAALVAGASYVAAMGVDYVRLERDRQRFVAATSLVPERARLLPLLFKQKLTSDNTRSLLHAWGFYVTERHTSAPLLFAHSHSFPVMYRTPPPPRFNHLVLEGFAPNMATSGHVCATLLERSIAVDDCRALFRARWQEFWHDAEPAFDHVLLWDAPDEALALVPSGYRTLYRDEHLTLVGRPLTAAR